MTVAPDAEAALLPLMLWLSPAFPVGSFAYSQGLEWAVEAGDVKDAPSLGGWLVDLLSFGAPRADAILFAQSFRAAEAEDWPALGETNELAVALANSAERRLETTAQGAAFVAAGARSLGLRAPAGPRRGGAGRVSGRRRRGRGRPRPAARAEPSGLRPRAGRGGGFRRGAPGADRPDRWAEDPGDADPAHPRARPRGGWLHARRPRRLRIPRRHRRNAPRDAVFATVPVVRQFLALSEVGSNLRLSCLGRATRCGANRAMRPNSMPQQANGTDAQPLASCYGGFQRNLGSRVLMPARDAPVVAGSRNRETRSASRREELSICLRMSGA